MTQKKQMIWRRLAMLLNVTFLFFTAIHFSYSTSYTWSGGTGDWSVSTNWTPNGVPGSGDNVTISASSAAVTLDAVTTVQSLVIDGSNSTLSLDFDLTVSGDLSLQQNSATINGNGNLSVGGNLVWDGGTIAGAGTFSLTGTYSSGPFSNTLDGRSLTLSSGGTFTNSNLDLDNNAILTIPSGQTFTMDITGAGLKEIGGDGTGTVINNGTIAVTGTGSPRFREASLTNNGAITLNAGGLSFSTGTHTHDGATITIASGNILKFEGGTSTFQNTTAISGDGSVYINSSVATLNLNSSSTISNYVDFAQGTLIINTANTFPSLDITTGGDMTLNANLTITNDMSLASSTSIIDGDSDLSIGGDFTWTSGTISGSGNVTVTGSLNGTSVGTLETKVLTLNAGGTLTNHTFTLKDNSKIIIPSGQTLTIDNSFTKSFTGSSGNFGTIENNGTIEKNGTGLLSVLFNTLDNNGTLNINNGTFLHSTASNSTHDNGTVVVASGATFRFSGNGTHEFSNTAISGDGLFNVQATATVNINAGCTFSLAFETSGGTTTFNVAATFLSLYMNDSGDILLNANLTITGNAEINGTNVDISGSGDLTINGTLTWGKGKISGSGDFTLLGVFTGVSSQNGNLDTRSLTFNAGATWPNFSLGILNGATITVPIGQTLTIDNSISRTTAGSGTIINNGTIIKNGAGQYLIQQTDLDNNGTITINAGKLSLGTSTSSTHDGATITIASGTEFGIGGGVTTHTFDNSDISGDGTFRLTTISGTVNINAGSTISTNIYAGSGGNATLTLNVAATIPSLEIVTSAVVLNANLTVTGNVDITASNSIVISGPGNLDIGGDLDWGGGTISGAGTLAVSGTMTADGSSTTLDARLLSLPSGGYISNGTFNIQNGASLTVPLGQTLTLHRTGGTGSVRTGSIIINGTVEKTGAGNYNFDGMDVDNNGTITVSEGKLSFDDSPGFCTSDHQNATINIASGSELIFDGTNVGNSGIHDFASTTINGPGTFRVSSFAVVNWNAGTTISNLPIVLSFGILNTNINLTFASLSLNGASSGLGGTFTTLDITGDLIWSISSIASTNPSTISVGGVTTVTGSGTTLSNATLTMNGGGTWTQTNCTVENNAEFIVPSGQTLTISNTATRTLTNGSGGGGTLTNNGTLIKSGSAIFNINTPYTSASGSTTDIQAGTLDLNNTFDNDGTVKGTGTLDLTGATVNGFGTFAPGSSPGTLTITGDYTNETLDIEIVDGMPVEFDQLIVSGAVTLGGTLNLTETGNVPAGSYTIITGSSVSGSFATLNLPTCYFVEVVGGNVNIIKGTAKVWDGSNGTWNTATSWLPNGVPCEYDDVVINSGVCDLNVAPEMASLTVNSGGTMSLTDGSTYAIDAPTVIAAGAIIQIDLGELVFIDDLTTDGTMAGFGTVNLLGATIIGGSGIYSPGASAGTLTVKGTHTNEEIQMEIGGTGGGVVKDLLEVTQTIELGGLFELGYLGGTVPAGTYEMMACNGGPNCVTGTFATVIFPPECQGGCSLEISPAGSEVNLVTTGDIQFTGECTWLGGNGPWDDQTNWSCNDVPNADDDVIIGAGQISLGSPVSMKTCQFTGGEIAGSGNMTVAELLTWAGGTLGANGNHDIASLNITGSCFLSEGTLLLNGTGTWENANLQLSNGSMFKIGAGETLTLNLTTNRQIDGGAGGGTFQNEGGTFVKTGGGDLSVNIPFVSSGNTNLLDGVLNLNDIFNNLGGILQGVAFLDVVDATVEDFGTVSPGTSPGTLTVLGDWLNNTLRYEIEEVSGMVNHDLLHVTQNGTFDGTLEILHLGGTVPYGDYPIVTCGGACSGTFTSITYPAFCAGECSVVYSGTDAVLHYQLVLPVELLSFTGRWKDNAVLLEWETAAEINHRGYFVERSLDGTSWSSIGFVEGRGNATEGSRYSFADGRPHNGENYYRLRMEDNDGTYEYSNVVSIQSRKSDWQIYPNPVEGELVVTLPENTNGSLQLFDWMGRTLWEGSTDGQPLVKVDMSHLPAGTYYLRMNNGQGRVVLKK